MKKSTGKSKFSVCRVCLAFDIRMHTMGPIILKIFEKITKTKTRPKDGKPNTVCYICFSLLKRCVMFGNMSRISDEIFTKILLTNPKITRDLIAQHSEGIVSTYHSTPTVGYSYSSDPCCSESVATESIVKGHVITEPTIKTEEEEEQVLVTITDIVMKEEPEETNDVLQNEQLIIVGNQTTEIEQDNLEQIVTMIAQKIENEQSDLRDKEISEKVTIKQENDDTLNTEKNMKTYKNSKNEENNNNSKNKLDKAGMDVLISELTQELEDGINAIEKESLRHIKKERVNVEDTEDCIIILSDEDESMQLNDRNSIIENDAIINEYAEHEAPYEPSKKKFKRRFECPICSKTFRTTSLLKRHRETHKVKIGTK